MLVQSAGEMYGGSDSDCGLGEDNGHAQLSLSPPITHFSWEMLEDVRFGGGGCCDVTWPKVV